MERRRWITFGLVAALAAGGLVAFVAIRRSAHEPGRSTGTVLRHAPPPRVAAHRQQRIPAGFVRPSASRTLEAPILMYHVIAPAPANAPFPGLYVTAADFAREMQALKRAGFRAVTLDELAAGWRGKAPLPRHPIVISFDNGYRSQYTAALPILRKLGWVGDENMQLRGLPPEQGGLSAREVHSMIEAGWEIDTQGWDHADLTRLNPAELRFQVAGARRRIRVAYHVPANWFCYPSGRYNPAVIAAVRAAGYVGATTVVPGWSNGREGRYTLPRLRVLAGTSPAALLAQIVGSRLDSPPPRSYLSAS